jgi:hypothetical protein
MTDQLKGKVMEMVPNIEGKVGDAAVERSTAVAPAEEVFAKVVTEAPTEEAAEAGGGRPLPFLGSGFKKDVVEFEQLAADKILAANAAGWAAFCGKQRKPGQGKGHW